MRHAARGWLFFSLITFTVLSSRAPAAEQDQFEERTVLRCAERNAMRSFHTARSPRTQWIKALEVAFPDKIVDRLANPTTEEDYAAWFELLVGKGEDWKKDGTTNQQLIALFEKVTQAMELGPVPSIKREEFMKFAKRHLMQENRDGGGGKEMNLNDDADKVFRVLDKNGDGELDGDELTLGLKEDKLKVDADGNGRVNKDEYRDYFKKKVASKTDAVIARINEERGMGGGMGTVAQPAKTNKNGLPEWFTTLDDDGDSQISVYEWRQGGKPLALFQDMDLNGDNLLTKEEYLRYVKLKEIELNQKKRDEGKK